ncbi:hypothetical protein [Streptomyces sp. NPDC093225]|uniref:hypothetical protein n=1 Tax=Streptomyces sp. NPDC093225 TaxID=3366034 RepID=UPI0038201DCC
MAAALSAVVAGVCSAGTAVATPRAGSGGGEPVMPEADVAYHGQVSLAAGRLGIWLVPENHGPAALPNATVRLRLSVDLAERQRLAEGCARVEARVVVCETGSLPVQGSGRHIGLVLLLKERPAEAVVRIDTWWNGGATDTELENNEHAVLALDTGDTYAF